MCRLLSASRGSGVRVPLAPPWSKTFSELVSTKAGQLSPGHPRRRRRPARGLDLEDLALLAEFDYDPGAVSQILDAHRRGYPVEYVAERIRRDRAEAAEQQRVVEGTAGRGLRDH